MHPPSLKKEKQIEKAIIFLAKKLEKCGKNQKSVLLHSIKVGMMLYLEGYEKDTVIAGILHDVLEDTCANEKEIEKLFGKRVKNLVAALTFESQGKTLEEKQKLYKQSFEKCLKIGKPALVIRAADILDNSNYYHLIKDKQTLNYVIEKMKCFIDIAKEELKREPIFKRLLQKQKEIIANF